MTKDSVGIQTGIVGAGGGIAGSAQRDGEVLRASLAVLRQRRRAMCSADAGAHHHHRSRVDDLERGVGGGRRRARGLESRWMTKARAIRRRCQRRRALETGAASMAAAMIVVGVAAVAEVVSECCVEWGD